MSDKYKYDAFFMSGFLSVFMVLTSVAMARNWWYADLPWWGDLIAGVCYLLLLWFTLLVVAMFGGFIYRAVRGISTD